MKFMGLSGLGFRALESRMRFVSEIYITTAEVVYGGSILGLGAVAKRRGLL